MKKTTKIIKHNIYRGVDELIKLDDLYNKESVDPFDACYNWDRLKEDLKKEGLTRPLQVFKCLEKKGKYYVTNGQHRLTILKELYDGDYSVPIVYKDYDIDRPCMDKILLDIGLMYQISSS